MPDVHLFQGREAVEGHAEMESLQQENEVLKAQMARLSAQLFEVSSSWDNCSCFNSAVSTRNNMHLSPCPLTFTLLIHQVSI